MGEGRSEEDDERREDLRREREESDDDDLLRCLLLECLFFDLLEFVFRSSTFSDFRLRFLRVFSKSDELDREPLLEENDELTLLFLFLSLLETLCLEFFFRSALCEALLVETSDELRELEWRRCRFLDFFF